MAMTEWKNETIKSIVYTGTIYDTQLIIKINSFLPSTFICQKNLFIHPRHNYINTKRHTLYDSFLCKNYQPD